MKNLVKYQNLSRAVIAVVLVVTVAASLWFASPTQTRALTIGSPTLSSTGTLAEITPEDIEALSPEEAATALEEMAIEQAAAIMEALTTEKLTNIIPAMSETSLTERLPELSPAKLYSIAPKVLFDSLPNVPTEQLVAEVPPQPPAELPAPVVVSTTPTEAKYRAAETQADQWVKVIGSPMPVEELLIKTKRSLKDVGTTVAISAEAPPYWARHMARKLPSGRIVSTYLAISFENATPEDIELGHLTFKVEKAWLKQNSLHKWSVVLAEWDPIWYDRAGMGQWVSLPTKRVKEDDSYVYYSAIVTRLADYAIWGSQAVPLEFKPTNLVVTPTEAEGGQKVTIKADITNLTDTFGSFAVPLWIDGTIASLREASLMAGETAPLSFSVTRQHMGNYQVRLDRLSGDFSVTTEAAPTLPKEKEKVVPRKERVVPGEEVPAPLAWWVWLIIGLAIVAVIGVIIRLVIRRRAA